MDSFLKQFYGIILIVVFLIFRPVSYDELVIHQYQVEQTYLRKFPEDLLINGGDQSKFGPGARAKSDARAQMKMKKGGKKLTSRGRVVDTIQLGFQGSFNSGPKIPNSRLFSNCPKEGPFPLEKDDDGYCIRPKNKQKFVRATHKHKIAKFTTPENENLPVQELSQALQKETISLETDVTKRQINEKSKHAPLFTNPDGSLIATKPEFRDSQVYYLEKPAPEKYYSEAILIGKGQEPKDVQVIVNDKTRECLVLQSKKLWNPQLREMEEFTGRDYIGPRVLSENQYKKFKRYGIIGKDDKDFSNAKHGMTATEFVKNRSDKPDSFDYGDQCSSEDYY